MDLLVARAHHRYAQFKVARDLAEIARFGVKKCNPLVLNGVFLFRVNARHVEFVHANQLVLQKTLVFDLNRDCIDFDLARVHRAGFEEQVLSPGLVFRRHTSNILFCRRVFGNPTGGNLN